MSSNGGHSEGGKSLAPSCRYVLDVVARQGPLSRQELLDETGLPERTLSRALESLQNGGYVDKTRKNDDLRKVVVTLACERSYNPPESDRSG